MSPQATFVEIRRLITEAKAEAAAEQLLAYLEQAAEPAASWRDTVRSLLAQSKLTKKEQQRNIISYENARLQTNQVTNGLLEVLVELEAGRLAPAMVTTVPGSQPGHMPWLTIGVVLALALAGASFLFLRNSQPGGSDGAVTDGLTTITTDVVEDTCPPYPVESKFNILLLPYQPLDGQQKTVENALRIRLAEKMAEYKIMGSVYTRNIDVNSNEYPLTSQQAAVLGKPCNAQLIIWGTTEETGVSNGLITTTKFRFIDSDFFSLTCLELNENAEVDTISSLSSIATNGELTGKVEATLRLIFGLVAYETDHPALAAEILETAIEEHGGVAKNPDWGMIQADSYIKSGQEERALEVYKKILKTDSTNVQAWNQKGLLEFRSGSSETAVQDLSRALVLEPYNAKLLAARAAVSVDRNELYQASADLERLALAKDASPTVRKIKANYAIRHEQEVQRSAESGKQLNVNPNDTSALRIRAESSLNLGELQTAKSAANNLLQMDPNNFSAIKTLIQIMPQVKDSAAVRRTIQRSLPQLSPEQQLRVRPLVMPSKESGK
ncbi:MAG: hypothetical protein DA408_11805 [Bacteroidetes bacterium]|nr:MAG: hypothetical protein DA408_11805 [Bacteroidota bacterium]